MAKDVGAKPKQPPSLAYLPGQPRVDAPVERSPVGLWKIFHNPWGVSSIRDLRRVLVVVDHALFRDLLVRFLSGTGVYEVVGQAAGTNEALDLCNTVRPEFGITRWTLPDGSAEKLLNAKSTASAPTRWLVLCDRPNGRSVQTAVGLGAQAVLMDTCDVAKLDEALRRLRDGGTFYCSASTRCLIENLRQSGPHGANRLSHRETEVLRLFAAGASSRTISTHLGVSLKTVQNQLSAMRTKLNIQSHAGLVRYAIEQGLDAKA